MTDWHWQIATVEARADGRRVLRFETADACARCARGEGCGAGVYARLFSPRHAIFPLGAQHEALAPGLRVRVGVTAARLLLLAGLTYGLPLLAFLGGALLGHHLAVGLAVQDLISLLSGLMLAAISLAWLGRFRSIGGNPRIEPLSCTAANGELESRT